MAAHQASPSLGFSRQEHWSGLPFSSPMHESGKWKLKAKSVSRVRLLATPWTAAYQAPPSMGFSRQEYWSGVPLPSPLLLLPSPFPSIRTIPMSQFFASGGQSIGVSVSVSVLPMNIQDWFLLGLTGLISLKSKSLSSLLQNHSSKASILWHSAFFIVQLSQPYMTTGKTIALTRQIFVGKVMSLLFNMLHTLEVVFLSRSVF